MVILSFSLFLLGFALIGIISSRYSKPNNHDYLLAGQTVKPWMVGLSGVATNCSGFMFIGLTGYAYSSGLSAIWLMIGFITGDFLTSFAIHKRFREVSGHAKVGGYIDVLSRWNGTNYRMLRVVVGMIIVICLSTYAAAQFNASGKAMYALFDWDLWIGSTIAAAIVFTYCFVGGMRASIWTDIAQSFVMISSILLLLIVAVVETGGFDEYWMALHGVSSSYMSLFPEHLVGNYTALFLFLFGWLVGGFGVAGQPHIMARIMTLDSADNMPRVRIYYYTWYASFSAMVIATGFAARVLLPELTDFDAELALPKMAQQLLPEAIVGVVLAGLFSATMSTADSQILSCSAAITNNINPDQDRSYWLTKIATALVTLVALGIAVFDHPSVFALVLMAWSALGASFAPLLAVYAFGGKPSERVAITMVLSGFFTAVLWKQYLGLSDVIYEIAPGVAAGFLVYMIAQLMGKQAKA